MKDTKKNTPDSDFPFPSVFSLKPAFQYWEKLANEADVDTAEMAKSIVNKVATIPALLENNPDRKLLAQHRSLLNLLLSCAMPHTTQRTSVSGAVAPMNIDVYHYTPSFKEICLDENDQLISNRIIGEESMIEKRILFSYLFIFKYFYNVEIAYQAAFHCKTLRKGKDVPDIYNITSNVEFAGIELIGELPKLSENEIKHLSEDFTNIELWMKLIPPHHFRFTGFTILSLHNVSIPYSTTQLKQELLKKRALQSNLCMDFIVDHLKIVMQSNNIKLGISAFREKQARMLVLNENFKSFLNTDEMDDACENCLGFFTESQMEKLNNKKAVIISNNIDKHTNKLMGQKLREQHIESYMLIPILFGNEFIGVLEIASEKEDTINQFGYNNLEPLLPFFSAAIKRSVNEIDNQIRNILLNRYTPIHPTVEWKFIEAAENFYEKANHESTSEVEDIVFEDVYPLYGASDIKNSSVIRNSCIQKDLSSQLEMASAVIQKILVQQPLPILEEIDYKLKDHTNRISERLLSGDEVSVLDNLKYNVEPVLRHMETKYPELAVDIQNYFNRLDPKVGIVYERRRDFEETITYINEEVSTLVEKEESIAQEMYPCYFENYKTDGVEFNIYIGKSLTKNIPFDKIYLKNIRLWQMILMCKIANRVDSIRTHMKIAMHTTQLVLIHSNPLAIRFRMDEKKFDVDGAYNIRYEIIKKRIDKAFIKNTNERLTKTGTIAIVYSHDKEAREYQEYIDYMIHKNYLTKDIEYFELEEMQGVGGLKAMRVTVNQNIPSNDELPNSEALMKLFNS